MKKPDMQSIIAATAITGNGTTRKCIRFTCFMLPHTSTRQTYESSQNEFLHTERAFANFKTSFSFYQKCTTTETSPHSPKNQHTTNPKSPNSTNTETKIQL
ncbi:hypothetical protein MLD38_032782 [Melastoma candidum]|uniref:Uncharacterized protein n=1 Tax=Melastoma candidum TaxID=119954 RepID=A0ACB9M4N7_9MYRT|nr:hypothetical protein MLD38_032782 [Melastoma candidum]